MDGISLSWRLLPQAIIDEHRLERRMIRRTEKADPEYLFLYRNDAVLPVIYGGQLRVFAWGNSLKSSALPRCREISLESLHAGEWNQLEPEETEIPATFGVDRGIWFRITQGIQGVIMRDQSGVPSVYMVTRESTHYYEVMTRNKREPLLIDETI